MPVIDVVINQIVHGTAIADTTRDMEGLGKRTVETGRALINFSTVFEASFLASMKKGDAALANFLGQLANTPSQLNLSTSGIDDIGQALGQFGERGLAATQGARGLSDVLGLLSPELGSLASALLAPAKWLDFLIKGFELVVKVAKQAVAAAAEEETAFVSLGATIKSMGLESRISAPEVERLADALMKTMNFDDEELESAAEILMRMDDFDPSRLKDLLVATADYAAGANIDLVTAAQNVAVALETGETKSLHFSKAVRGMVSDMVAAGDAAGATSLIIQQLNENYGGDAVAQMNTYAGAQKSAKLAWEELQAIDAQGATKTASAWDKFWARQWERMAENKKFLLADSKAMEYVHSHGYFESSRGPLEYWRVTREGIVETLSAEDVAAIGARKLYMETGLVTGAMKAEIEKADLMTERYRKMAKAAEEATIAEAEASVATLHLGGNDQLTAIYTSAFSDMLEKTGDKLKAIEAGTKAVNDELANMAEKAAQAAVAFGVSGQLGKIFADAAPDLGKYTQSLEYYQRVLQTGPADIAYYSQAVDDMAEAFGVGSEEYERAKQQLEAAQTDYANAGGMVESLTTKINDLTTATNQQVASLVYQQTASTLNAAGQLDLARAFGLISEQDYAVAMSLQALTTQYDLNHDGLVDAAEGQEEYTSKIELTNEAIQYARDHNQPITQEFINNYIDNHTVKVTPDEESTQKAIDNIVYFHGNAGNLPEATPIQQTVEVDVTANTEEFEMKFAQLQQFHEDHPYNVPLTVDDVTALATILGVEDELDSLPTNRPIYIDDVTALQTIENLKTTIGEIPTEVPVTVNIDVIVTGQKNAMDWLIANGLSGGASDLSSFLAQQNRGGSSEGNKMTLAPWATAVDIAFAKANPDLYQMDASGNPVVRGKASGGPYDPNKMTIVGDIPGQGWGPQAEILYKNTVIPHSVAQKMKDAGMLDGAYRAAAGGFWAGTHWVPVVIRNPQSPSPWGKDGPTKDDGMAKEAVSAAVPAISAAAPESSAAMQSVIETAVAESQTMTQAATEPVAQAAEQISESGRQTAAETARGTAQSTRDMQALLGEVRGLRLDMARRDSNLRNQLEASRARIV